MTDKLSYWSSDNNAAYGDGGFLRVGQPIEKGTPGTPVKGTLTVNGSAIVDVFNTGGYAQTVINGKPLITAAGTAGGPRLIA